MDEARLRDKLAKLDRLASDRNPNVHEREAARVKAAKLRERLPPPPDPWAGVFKPTRERPHAPRTAVEVRTMEQKIGCLVINLHKLKPASQLMATELAMDWAMKAELTKGQWRHVDLLINEIEG